MRIIVIITLLLISGESFSWGFYAHKLINRMAIYTLPPEMMVFFKANMRYISENAVAPDKRRSVMKEEGARHFIDLDVYGDSALFRLPKYWHEAASVYSEDTLLKYGIAPWHVYRIKNELTEAFRQKNVQRILRLAADLGHYIADANVPLHTTHNYNGQLTGQHGIHGFWESRLPELFSDNYDFFVGKANYLEKPQLVIWEAVGKSHAALDSVFNFEKIISLKLTEDRKFGHEQRGAVIVKVYSKEFSSLYHQMLAGQVERRMRESIKMIGDFWYTCWIDAGQPDLQSLIRGFSPQDPNDTVENAGVIDSCH
jgi:hypothetical protein